jgi:hypothetical protein
VRLRSFKLQLTERRARIVPAEGAPGCPFSGPGVDLTGAAADEAIAAAAPMLAALAAIEPGITVRSISVDLERMRLLATLTPPDSSVDARPRVVRIDESPALRGVLQAAEGLVDFLVTAAARALERREGKPK